MKDITSNKFYHGLTAKCISQI